MNEIDLSWELNTIGAENIEVDRSTDGSTWTAITTTLPGTTLSYAAASVSENTQYYYKVRAIHPDSSTSAFTNVADAYSLPAITDLAASAASASEIDLSWTTNITNATAIEVDSSPDGTTWTTLTSTLDPTATTYAHTALSESTQYYYRVHAIISGATSEEPAYTNATTLAAVDSLSATAASTSEIDLTWSVNVSDATATEIDRSSDGGTTWTTLTSTLDPATTTYADTGLDDNADYTYQVRVIRPGGDSAYTAPTDVFTLADIDTLAAAPNVFGGVDLTWNLNVTDATGLSIYQAVDGGAYSLLTDSISPTAASYHDSSTSEGHEYSYQLQATFTGGTGNFSDPVDVSTAPIQDIAPVPDSSTTSISLNWSNYSPSPTSIEVDYSTDDETFTALTTSLDGSSTSYDATGLTADTAYYFQVKIVDGIGTTTSGVVYTCTLPAAPTDLTSTSATPTEVDLSWVNNASSADPVFIERSDNGGTDYSIIDEVSGTATSYQDTSVTDGTNYVYQVDAVGADGFDANPTTSTVSVFAPLAAPTQLTLTQNGPNEIDLSWNNASQTATGYVVQRSTDGTSFSNVGTIGYADDSFFSDTGLSAGTQYYYRVEATDADSDLSSCTAIATNVTAPGLSLDSGNAASVYEGSTYTLTTDNVCATGQVDPIQGWTINWGDGSTTNASGLANGDPGSFTHAYTTTGFYTITASTIDGSFSGTQNVESEYDYGSDDDRIAVTTTNSGMSSSVSAVYTDPAGHHVTTWVVSWGDGTIQTYGSSDSSTDGSDSDPTSTDTKAFSHTYADAPNYSYQISITAVTDENVYEAGTSIVTSSDTSWSSDTMTVGTTSSNTSLYPTPIDGVSDAEAVSIYAPPGNFSVNWGDGSSATTFYGSSDVNDSPAHQYNQAGTYIITVTETPDGGGGTLTGHAFMPIAAGTPAMPTMNDQVLAAGAALGITEGAAVASGDPEFGTIEFDNGTAPQVVPITDGAIDLTAVDAPSNFVGTQATDGVSTYVNAYNAAFQGCMQQEGFLTDAWSAEIDNGESNDLLMASSDGTQNLQTVRFDYPHPAGVAYDVTLTDSDPTDADLWSNATPTPGAMPLCGGDDSTYTFTTDPAQSSSTFDAGAILGDATLNPLHFTFAGVQDVAASTSGSTSPSASAATQPASTGKWQIVLSSNPNATPGGSSIVTGLTQNWLVGQVVQMSAAWSGPGSLLGPENVRAIPRWRIPGDTLFSIDESGDQKHRAVIHLKTINISDGVFSKGIYARSIAFFWNSTTNNGDSPDSEVCSFTYTSNDAPVSTTFDVYTPTSSVDVAQGAPSVTTLINGQTTIGLNSDGVHTFDGPGITWTGSASTPAGHGFGAGKLKVVQLVSPGCYINGKPVAHDGDWGLDGSDPYSTSWSTDAPGVKVPDQPGFQPQNTDTQTDVCAGGTFHTFLMYQAPGASAWVTLEEEDWSYSAQALVKRDKPDPYYAIDQSRPQRTWKVIPPFARSSKQPEWSALWSDKDGSAKYEPWDGQ